MGTAPGVCRSVPRVVRSALLAATCLASLGPAPAAQIATRAPIAGTIDYLFVDDVQDHWSSGMIVIGGQNVILPRNLVIELPANRMTLQQLFRLAPPSALALGESGLAFSDRSARGRSAHATVHANRMPSGNLVAGELFIEKALEGVTGEVTYIDYDAGYFMVNGVLGDPFTGAMLRINDPTSRFSIQSGKGCDGGPNCSADPRFAVDSDNYTITFATGYPACLPSATLARFRSGFQLGDPALGASDPLGQGDPFCPCENRLSAPVDDSTRFAPIMLGDTLAAAGNFETVQGARFLSAHTVVVFDKLMTKNDPDQPDYMIMTEALWPLAGYQSQSLEAVFHGASTLPDSQLDLFKLHKDPNTGIDKWFAFGTTVGNPDTVHAGVWPVGDGLFGMAFEIDFVFENEIFALPCVNIQNGGLGTCNDITSLADNFALMNPAPREVIGRTRHQATLSPGILTRDLNGNQAPNGQYLTPVHLAHPELLGLDLAAGPTPFLFAGMPWLLDRRLGPGGCEGGCEGTPQPLDPFPFSGLDPRTQASLPVGVEDSILSYYPFGASDVLAWPPPGYGGALVLPTPNPALPCAFPVAALDPLGGSLTKAYVNRLK